MTCVISALPCGFFRQAVDARDVPGVVAMAATERGLIYGGAFGVRVLDRAAPMTLDTVFHIASVTKAVTSVAAMQFVEQGKLKLEEPVPNIDPALGSPQVLEGFDAAGTPRFRAAKRPITLRHLLTHTTGFTYDIWDANTGRYAKAAAMPARATAKVASIRTPLAFDPGDRRQYGVNTDWVGRLVEAVSGQALGVYFREKIFAHGGSWNGARLLRRAETGTVSWGGIFNTYFWLDPAKRVTGLIMTQILPLADPRVLKLYGQFERETSRAHRRP